MNVAYIPARGGSKSIPLKNIRPLAGRPLVYWALKAACECGALDRVFVSTDSKAIAAVVSGFGFPKVEVAGRSAESATDAASTEAGLLEFAKSHEFEAIALIQATSPLLTAADLDRGFRLFARGDVDSVLSVVRQKRFVWRDSENGYAAPLNYDYLRRPRRQDFEGLLVENGAFYLTGREALLRSGCRISGNIKTVEMPPASYAELDEPEDWPVVESLLLNRESAGPV
jgi:N-acylneuraminate cytidylyltransferase